MQAGWSTRHRGLVHDADIKSLAGSGLEQSALSRIKSLTVALMSDGFLEGGRGGRG